ncbi:MAG: hypothetical protein NTX37_05190 [Burkholderiales bacterium]|nr:hypothetical protein [Burkholderiales bacterium]
MVTMIAAGLPVPACAGEGREPDAPATQLRDDADGLLFDCPEPQRAALPVAMASYLRELGIDRSWVVQTQYPDGTLSFRLDTAPSDTDTLTLARRLHLHEERVTLPRSERRYRFVSTVSRKEILLALMQHGRQTRFSGAACDFVALREHVALRQSVVSWVEELDWTWPEGQRAQWNPSYWTHGVLTQPGRLDDALLDAFIHQHRYAIGCYTAAKLSFAHGILDFYRRIRKEPAKAELIRDRLLRDSNPLGEIEPAATWDFEPEFEPVNRDQPGKLLGIERGVAHRNFVPGDWAYLLNTDPVSSRKTGYEGSNAIYLGRGRFADFYDDHKHGYSYREKLDEVYQWRHGVFNRSRDAALVKPLSEADYERLSETPEQGGLLLDIRLTPLLFGFQPGLETGTSEISISADSTLQRSHVGTD